MKKFLAIVALVSLMGSGSVMNGVGCWDNFRGGCVEASQCNFDRFGDPCNLSQPTSKAQGEQIEKPKSDKSDKPAARRQLKIS